MIGNKIADKITKVSKLLPQNNSEAIISEHEKKKKYLEKDIYVQRKDMKLLMNLDLDNSIIVECQKTVEATGDLTGNKSANEITKVSRNLIQNNPETITNEHDKEIPRERYISP